MTLTEIREREKLATKGPWEEDNNEGYGINQVIAGRNLIANVIGDSAEADANMHFIAHARADIPYLLSLIDRAEGIIREYRNGACPEVKSDKWLEEVGNK